jgi:hypothetical protein
MSVILELKERWETYKLRRKFNRFIKQAPTWAGKPDAFKWFCQLEKWGAERVRQKLARGEFDGIKHEVGK